MHNRIRRGRIHPFAAFIATWVVFTSGFVLQHVYWLAWAKQVSRPFPSILGAAITIGLSVAVSIFAMIGLARLRPLQKGYLVSRAALYILASVLLMLGVEWTEWYSIVVLFRTEPPFTFLSQLASYSREIIQLLGVALAVNALRAADELRNTDLAVARYRADMQVRSAALSEGAARAQLGILRAELKPHFLFNVLHTVAAQVRLAPNAAVKTLDLLAQLVTKWERLDTGGLITLEEELRGLEPYLALVAIRFGDRIRISICVDEDTKFLAVVPFILQPLIENAVKHAVGPSATGGHIRIKSQCCGGDLELSVADDGPGSGSTFRAPGMGLGLTNLRSRLQSFCGPTALMELTHPESGGTVARIVLPRRFYSEIAQKPSPSEKVAAQIQDIAISLPEAPSVPSAPAVWTGFTAVLFVWTVLEAVGLHLAAKFYSIPQTWAGEVVTSGAMCLAWLPIAGAVFAVVRRAATRESGRLFAYLVQFTVAVGLTMWWLALAWWIANVVVRQYHPFAYRVVVVAAFGRTFVFVATLFVAAHWLQSTRRSRDRAVREIQLQGAVRAEHSRLRARALSERARALRVEMSGRFLDSAVDAIRDLVTRDAAMAQRIIVRLADVLRAALRRSENELVSVKTAFEALQPMIDLEQFRYEGRLRVTVQIEPVVVSRPIASTLVEQMFAASMSLLDRTGGSVHLCAAAYGQGVRLKTDIHGRLHTLDLPSLNELRESFRLVYDTSAEMILVNRTTGGVEIVLEAPALPEPSGVQIPSYASSAT